MNRDRNNYNNNGDDDYYRKRDRNYRDDGYYSSSSRRRRTRSRSRDNNYVNEMNEEDSWSNRDKHYNDRRKDRNNRDRRDYTDRRENNHHQQQRQRHYESEESDGGSNYGNEQPNNKVIVRGLPAHITEADIQCDLIQSGLKPVSIRLIRKKSTGVSRGFCFVQFSSVDEARTWIEKKQGVLLLQDQHRAIIQYSFMKENDGQYDKIQTDWYCGKCGVFNFKRRENCFKCNASRQESGSEGFDEISTVLTKKIMLRNLDALSTEETVLIALQDKLPDNVSKISKILICRDPLTQVSRGVCYLNFDNLVDSMNTFQAIEKLSSLNIDGRDVSYSYCMDGETPRVAPKPSQNNGNRRDNNNPPPIDTNYSQPPTYQYTLADVPQLAEQAATMYAQNPAEKESYMKYYTEYYTNQINAGTLSASMPYEAHSGASIAQSAIERKQKMKIETPSTSSAAPYPAQQVETPKGNDGKKYPIPDVSQYFYDDSSGYYYDQSTGLYYDASSQYYYNSEIGQYLYWDASNLTYVLASPNSTGPTANTPSTSNGAKQDIPPPPKEEEKDKKQKDQPQDKVKVAKKIVKDMEKWAKQLNQKKDYTPIQVQQVTRNENSLSPPPSMTMSMFKAEAAMDIGFSMLEKKDRPITTLTIPTITPTVSKVVIPYHSDSDEDQAAHKSSAAASTFNENDLVDFEKLTCLLCKRAFPSLDVLTKHIKISNLHKENIQKYKLQNGMLDIAGGSNSASISAQNYRDRAKERRMKYGEADPLPPVNRAKERFQREMEKKASITQSYQAQVIASKPIDDSNIGNKLLKAMGWKEGSGLGKSLQGRTEIIEAEQRNTTAGLGSKNASYGAGPQDDYKSYIKKMMKKRYEEVN
ncbi:unnamed protein product [Chironomus riparius]|uniref:RNA-binding protein 5 n=1 Tax=Chironomus riparius TaxID=315576 RepID=A0A9N9WNB2_9DIPT|nr:unnamed protein product [Chironomus riparius]